MHYKNGRLAKDGDKIISLAHSVAGILHSSQPQSLSCNGRIARTSDSDPYVTIGECLHIDDIAATANTLQDISKLPPPPSAS